MSRYTYIGDRKKEVSDQFFLDQSRVSGSLQWINMFIVLDGTWALFQPEKLQPGSPLTRMLTGAVARPVAEE